MQERLVEKCCRARAKGVLPTPKTARHAEVYDPAEDSFLFLDALQRELPFIASLRPTLAVEIGSGSGVLGAFLLRELRQTAPLFLVGIDINSAAAATSRETYDLNAVGPLSQAITADLFAALRLGLQADVVLFNPPYVETDRSEVGAKDISAAWAGGPHGLDVILAFLEQLPSRLSSGGLAYLLVEKRNLRPELWAALDSAELDYEVISSERRRNEVLSILRLRRRVSDG